MKKLLRPDRYVRDVGMISPKQLKERGISFVLLDRDNTIIPRDTKVITPIAQQWLNDLAAEKIDVALISNNWAKNVSKTADELNIGWTAAAAKPLPFKYWLMLHRYKKSRKETAMVGDQVFTDILGAKLLGIYSVLVAPQTEVDLKHTLFLRKYEDFVLGDMPIEERE